MATKRKLFLVIFICLGFFTVRIKAQKILQVGDTFPPSIGRNVKFLDGTVGHLATGQNKLTLLDFWNVECKSCIAAFPALESIQEEFKEHLSVVTITYNKDAEVKDLFRRLKRPVPRFSAIVSDTLLNSRFATGKTPITIWVDGNGLVRRMTQNSEVTRANIQKAIYENNFEGANYVHVPGTSFQEQKLLPLVNAVPSAISQYSFFSRYVLSSDLNAGYNIVSDSTGGGSSRISVCNKSVLFLYLTAYKTRLYGFDINLSDLEDYSRIIIHNADRNKLLPPAEAEKYDSWADDNVFSYELMLKGRPIDDAFTFMSMDLDRHFSVKSSLEERQTSCLALIRTDSIEKFVAPGKGGFPKIRWSRDSFVVENADINKALIQHFTATFHNEGMPVVNATGYEGRISIKLEGNVRDRSSLRKELQKWGLDLVEKTMPIKMLLLDFNR